MRRLSEKLFSSNPNWSRRAKGAAALALAGIALLGCAKGGDKTVLRAGGDTATTATPTDGTTSTVAAETTSASTKAETTVSTAKVETSSTPAKAETSGSAVTAFEANQKPIADFVQKYSNTFNTGFEWGQNSDTGVVSVDKEDLAFLDAQGHNTSPNKILYTLETATKGQSAAGTFTSVSMTTETNLTNHSWIITADKTASTPGKVRIIEKECPTQSSCSDAEFPPKETPLTTPADVTAAFSNIKETLSVLQREVPEEQLIATGTAFHASPQGANPTP